MNMRLHMKTVWKQIQRGSRMLSVQSKT